MTNNGIAIIKLSCVSCGSNLDISQQMDRLACGHCGAPHIVERSGGAVHLRGVAEALTKVQVGTDKTAAELAIVRLTSELQGAQFLRADKEQHWMNVRTQRLYEWNNILLGKKNSVNLITIAAGIVGALPSLIISSAVNAIMTLVFPEALGAFLAVVVFFAGCGAAAWFIRDLMHKSDKYNPDKLQGDCDEEFAKLDAQIGRELRDVDDRIAALLSKVQLNYQVANA